MPIDLRPPFYILGALLCIAAAGMLVPALADAFTGGPDEGVFAACAGVGVFAGGILMFAFRPRERLNLNVQQAFLLTCLAWIALTLLTALPMAAGSYRLSYVDAVFEAMSGLTTTGSTVIVGLDKAPTGLLLWRALLQWFGGVGIIVMAVAILPFLRIGGMQLFRTESSDKSDKFLPRVSQVAVAIVLFYLAISVLFALAMWATGVSLFDAVCHMMAAVATGGFSNLDASVGGYGNPAFEWACIAAMAAGGSTFVVLIRAWQGDRRALWQDTQLRAYVGILLAAAVSLTLWQTAINDQPAAKAFRDSLFATVSIVTTTGFVTEDYTTWGAFPITLVFFLTFIGGCTGSTSGGLKVFRVQILVEMARIGIARLTHPNAVYVPMFNRSEVSRDVINSVLGFVFLYGMTFAVLSVGLSAFGLDIVTSLSGAATALGNVGPGLGDKIGPAGNFAGLPDGAKVLLTIGMLMGRLELLTLLVLFTRGFWRG